jgi:hypothetical protein
VARGSPAVTLFPSVLAKVAALVDVVLVEARCRPPACPARRINAIPEFVLGRANLGQQHDRIERAILIAQPFLHVRGYVGMRQGTLIGRRWEML